MGSVDCAPVWRLRQLPGARHRAVLHCGSLRLPAAIGRNGITHWKREGDGATPAGRLHPLRVLYRPDRMRPPRTELPVRPIHPDDGWCDDPDDRAYNRLVRLPHSGGHEVLTRADRLYDIVVILDWNMHPRRPGLGSAIFLHIAPPNHGPTAGCIAVSVAHMRRLVALLHHGSEILVA